MRKRRVLILAALAVLSGGVVAYLLNARGGETHTHTAVRVSDKAKITLPALSDIALSGKVAFDENCAVCHGQNAVGSDQGPPLIHIIYEPGHHNDASFYRAVAQGVRGHHWRFGNMPVIEGVSEAQVTQIIAYIRETQRANGIN